MVFMLEFGIIPLFSGAKINKNLKHSKFFPEIFPDARKNVIIPRKELAL